VHPALIPGLRAHHNPDGIALVDTTTDDATPTSNTAFAARTAAVAGWLDDCGIGPGAVVAVVLDPRRVVGWQGTVLTLGVKLRSATVTRQIMSRISG
jgi:hypothetical protein